MKKINCPNVAKNLFILLIVSLVFAIYFQSNAYALTSDNINFQGKIVRNDTGYEGLNVVPGSPACVVDGAGNDTCDFQVAYYTASTAGTLLLTETFTNVEIGQYDGVFELSLGSGSMTTTGQCRDGTCNTPVEVISEYKDVYLELKFSPDGTNLTETFTRMPLEASPYAILSKYAEGANDAFKLSTSVSSGSQASPVTGMVYYNTTTSQLTVYNGTSWGGIKSSLWTDAGTFTYLTSTTDDLVLGASTVSDSTFFFDMDGSSGSYLEIDDASNTNRLLTILSGGNVGIGTATPGAKLEVAGSSSTITNASGNLTISTGGLNGDILLSPHGTGRVLVSTKLGIKDTGTTPTHYTFFQGGDQSADITYTLPNADGTASGQVLTTNASGVLSWQTVATGSTAWDDILDPDSNSVIVHGGYSTDMQFDTFTSGSAFKISSTATGLTGSLFDVSLTGSNVANTGSLFAINNTGTLNTNTSFLINHYATGTGNLAFRVNDESGDTTPFVIDGTGNVGIGTATPTAAYKLDTIKSTYGIGDVVAISGMATKNTSEGQGSVSITGVLGQAIKSSAGTYVGYAYGFRSYISNTTGTMVNAYGYKVDNLSNAGSITDTYGVYVGDLSIGTQTNTPYSFYASDVNTFNYFAGNVGIGVTSPTAYLNLKPGTAAANTAPLKFTTGVNLTTAESGAMEWDGSRLYMTNTTPTRNTLAYLSDLSGLITGVRWDEIGNPQANKVFTMGSYSSDMQFDSFTAGSAFKISSAATGLTGSLFDVSLSGSNAANTGSLFALNNTGALNTNTSFLINHYATGTSNLAFRVNDESGDTTPFVIDGGGNVGVGTLSPDKTLDVLGTIQGYNFLTSGGLPVNDILVQQEVRNFSITGLSGSYGLEMAKFEAKKSTTLFDSGHTQYISTTSMSNGNVLVAYTDGDNSGYGTFIIYDSSGNEVKSATVYRSYVVYTKSAQSLNNGNVLIVSVLNSKYFDVTILDPSGNILNQFSSSDRVNLVSATVLTNGNFLIAYDDYDDSNIGKFVIYDSSGNLIKGETVFGGISSGYISVSALADGNVLIAYRDGSNLNYGTFVIYDSTGTLIKSSTIFESAASSFISTLTLNNGNLLIAYRDEGNVNYGTFVIYDITGNLVKSATVFESAATQDISITNLLTQNFLIAYRDGGNSNFGTYVIYDSRGNLVESPTVISSTVVGTNIYASTFNNGDVLFAFGTSGYPGPGYYTIWGSRGTYFANRVGIGTTSPLEKLHITNGSLLIDTPTTPVLKGTYDTTDVARDVYVSGKYAYVADGLSGLHILDISNPASPTLIGTYDSSAAYSIHVAGKYAYLADSSDFRIIDISNPTAPTLVSIFDAYSAQGVYVSGKYAYLADSNVGLKIVDISNPAAPFLAGSIDTYVAMDVYVSGKYAYIADHAQGLKIIDISNPTSPTQVGSLAGDETRGIYVSGKYAYAAIHYPGLRVIDISNPTTPVAAGTYNTSGLANGVYVSGKYAYVADDTSGLQIIDISNPASPALKGTYDTPGNALDIFVSGKYAYVADGSAGLQIIDIFGADIHAANIGNLSSSNITVGENVDIGNNLYVRNGLNVGPGGLYVDEGEVSFDSNSSATAFSFRQKGVGDILNVFDNTTEVFTILDGGNVGIGVSSPTGVLHLKAGTAAANTAPLKFTTGVNLTTAESGAMEWDGSRLYMTNTTPTRNTLAYLSDLSGFLTQGYQTIQEEGGAGLTQRSILNFVGSGFTATDDGANTRTNITLNSKLNAYADLVSANGVLTNTGGTLSWVDLNRGDELLPTGTEGQMLYYDATTTPQWKAFSGMYWDDVNSRLGIGTTSPGYPLDVLGNARVGGNIYVDALIDKDYSGNSITFPSSLNIKIGGSYGLNIYSWQAGNQLTLAGGDSGNTSSVSKIKMHDNIVSLSHSGYSYQWAGIDLALNLNLQATLGSYDQNISIFKSVITTTNDLVGGKRRFTDFNTDGVDKHWIDFSGNGYFAGNVGIGDTTPATLLSVGSGDLFQVNTSGDLIKIKNVTYSWPSSNGSGVLTNNGSGTLTWTAGTVDTDVLVAIDSSATAGYIGATGSDGVLRASSPISYTDGGDYITLGITANSITGAHLVDDTLDYVDFDDTLDLDANLIQNQSTYTWTQNFTGTTTTGLTYNANSLTSGTANLISSTSTAGIASGSSYLLRLDRSGANANTAHTAYGVYSTVTNTNATSGTNIAGYFSASGATTANYGLLVANGNVGIGTTTPSNKFVVNTSAYSTIELQYGGTSVVDIFSNVSSNIFIGLDSGSVISTGTGNIALGDNALSANTTGLSNTAIGHFALDSNVAKQGSTALGYQAMMYANSTATAGLSYNTAIGYQALTGSGVAANNTGTQNTAVGHQSMTANTSGSSNTALGVNTLNANTTGTQNVAIGQNALFTNVAKQGSVAIGYEAMRYAHSTATPYLSQNTAIGYQALMGSSTAANNTGTQNSILGFQAGLSITSGGGNTFLGRQAGRANTTGSINVAIGAGALSENMTGTNNVVIGFEALGINAVGNHSGTIAIGSNVMSETGGGTTGNIGIGESSMFSVSGNYNIALGYAVGETLTSGSYNILIGYSVEATSPTGSYQLNIGNSIYGNLSNDYISIGDSTPTEGMFTVGATSQFRIDTNGDLTRIKDVPYTWPNSNASGILANNGSGTLSWSTIASLGGVTGTGSGTATAGQITWWNGTSTITGENDFYWDASNNRLGIGTSTPTASIDIAGASSTISNASGNITITPASNLIVSQGYVGIGTASPTSTLDLYHATVGPVLTLRSGIADYSGVIMFKDQTNSTNARINANLADSYYSNSLSFQSTSGLNFVSNSISSDQYPAMIITYAGSVGIGDTSPASLLTVGSGDLFRVSSTGELGIGVAPSTSYSIYTTGRSYGIYAQGSSMGGRFYDTSGTSTTYVAYGNYGLYTAQNGYFGGNVGIRTTSANNPLSVVSPSSSVSAIQFGLTATAGGYLMSSFDHQFNISGGARYTTGAYWEARSTTASIIGSYNGELMFYNNTGLTVGSTFTPTERMRIDSSGNVGIGTTSPAGLLHLYGTTDDVLIIHARDTGQGRIFFREGGGATYGGLVGYDSVNDRLELSTLNNSVEMPGIYIARTTGYVTHPSGHADLAENYQSVGTVLRGSLVSINTTTPWTVTAANMEKKSLVGVVTTNPGAVMDADGGFQIGYTTKLVYKNEKTPIALVGTAPTLVTHINGSIDIGDSIGVSELNGFGAKMTTAGYTVGKALERIDTNSCISASSIDSINWPDDDGKNTLKPCYVLPDGTIVGKIMVAIQPSWYDPGSTSTTENISIPGWYRIASLSRNTNDYGRFKINNTSVGSSQNLLISVDSLDTKENINVVSNFMSGDYNITKTRINSGNGTKYLEIYLPNVNGNQIKVNIDGGNGDWVSTSITQVIEETLTIKEYSLSGLLFGVSDMLQVEDTGLKVGGDLIASTTTANIGDTISRWNDIYAKGAIRLGSGSGQEGAIRFNTESKRLELSNDGSTWVQLGDLTSQMVISAEYPGAILFADGSDNLGKMTSDAIEENATFKNYYEWISNKEVAQDYDILVRITLPNDFVSWKDDAIYLDYMTQNSVSVENNSVDVTLIGNSGVDAQSVDHISTLPGAWERMSLKSLDINDCNAPGDSCTLRISLTSSMEYFTRVGDITLNYNRSL